MNFFDLRRNIIVRIKLIKLVPRDGTDLDTRGETNARVLQFYLAFFFFPSQLKV